MTLAVTNIEITLGNMQQGIEEFEQAYVSFIENYEAFYDTLDSRTWPFITGQFKFEKLQLPRTNDAMV